MYPEYTNQPGNSNYKEDEGEDRTAFRRFPSRNNGEADEPHPVSIEREIKTRFGDVVSIQLREVSLKVKCRSEEQRDKIRGCTSLGDTSVVPSLPFSEERRRREAISKLHRVAVGGVPVDMVEDDIKNETGAALVKRISKRDQSGVLMPTMTVMLAYNNED